MEQILNFSFFYLGQEKKEKERGEEEKINNLNDPFRMLLDAVVVNNLRQNESNLNGEKRNWDDSCCCCCCCCCCSGGGYMWTSKVLTTELFRNGLVLPELADWSAQSASNGSEWSRLVRLIRAGGGGGGGLWNGLPRGGMAGRNPSGCESSDAERVWALGGRRGGSDPIPGASCIHIHRNHIDLIQLNPISQSNNNNNNNNNKRILTNPDKIRESLQTGSFNNNEK